MSDGNWVIKKTEAKQPLNFYYHTSKEEKVQWTHSEEGKIKKVNRPITIIHVTHDLLAQSLR